MLNKKQIEGKIKLYGTVDAEISDIKNAWLYGTFHKDELLNDKACGCFYCLKIYSPKDIIEWCDEDGDTALCPHCGIDSVIGESSGYPITREFLQEMHNCYFKSNSTS